MSKQPSMTIGLYVKYKNDDSSMSIYRDGKFIAALEDTTASCDLVYKMSVEILELEEKLKETIKALKFYAEKTNYKMIDEGRNYDIDYVLYEESETLDYNEIGSRAKKVLEYIK